MLLNKINVYLNLFSWPKGSGYWNLLILKERDIHQKFCFGLFIYIKEDRNGITCLLL